MLWLDGQTWSAFRKCRGQHRLPVLSLEQYQLTCHEGLPCARYWASCVISFHPHKNSMKWLLSYTCENWNLQRWRNTHGHKSPKSCWEPLSLQSPGVTHVTTSLQKHCLCCPTQKTPSICFVKPFSLMVVLVKAGNSSTEKEIYSTENFVSPLKTIFPFDPSYLFFFKMSICWVTWTKQEGAPSCSSPSSPSPPSKEEYFHGLSVLPQTHEPSDRRDVA